MQKPSNSIIRSILRSPATLLILLALIAIWSMGSLKTSKSNALLAADDLKLCHNLAADIEILRQKPSLANTQFIETRELAKLIESAADISAIPQNAIGEITPEPPQRLGDLPYLQKPTTLTLRDVSLPQLGPFLHHLSHDSSLIIRDLRLTSLKHDETRGFWNADIVLTHRVYSPVKTDSKP